AAAAVAAGDRVVDVDRDGGRAKEIVLRAHGVVRGEGGCARPQQGENRQQERERDPPHHAPIYAQEAERFGQSCFTTRTSISLIGPPPTVFVAWRRIVQRSGVSRVSWM